MRVRIKVWNLVKIISLLAFVISLGNLFFFRDISSRSHEQQVSLVFQEKNLGFSALIFRKPSLSPSPLPSPSSAAVIRIIHQSWINYKLPPLFARWTKSFSRCMPRYRRILWSDADNRKLIADHYKWFLPRYDALERNVQRADMARLFYMYHYGGVYCDLDCECLQNFEHLLVNTSLAFGAMSGWFVGPQHDAYVQEGHVENSFMYSRPKHPLVWSMIRKVYANETDDMKELETGIYLVMKAINSARKSGLHLTKFDDLPYLTVYPAEYFNPYSWINPNSAPNCRSFAEFSDEGLEKCRQQFVNKTTFIVQYHTQVWDKGRRNVLRDN